MRGRARDARLPGRFDLVTAYHFPTPLLRCVLPAAEMTSTGLNVRSRWRAYRRSWLSSADDGRSQQSGSARSCTFGSLSSAGVPCHARQNH